MPSQVDSPCADEVYGAEEGGFEREVGDVEREFEGDDRPHMAIPKLNQQRATISSPGFTKISPMASASSVGV